MFVKPTKPMTAAVVLKHNAWPAMRLR